MSFPPPDPAHDANRDAQQPTPVTPAQVRPNPSVRAGDLVPAWRAMLGLGWTSAFFAYAAVWQASVQIGIGTWWVGPRAQPTHLLVKLIPFYLTLVVGLLIAYNVRWIVRWSAVGVAAAVLISIPDFSRSVGVGVAEAVIAALLGVITLASLSGRYRVAQPATADDTPPTLAPGPLDPASR